MAARVLLREITNEEGNRLLRIVRRDVGLGGDVAARADRAAVGAGDDAAADQRGRVHRPRHGPRRDPQLQPRRLRRALSALPGRAAADVHAAQAPGDQADRAQRSRTDLGQPFATWTLAKLADYLVAEGVVTDISHEGLRQLLREEGVRFQAVRTWKRSNDPDFEAKTRPDRRALRARRGRPGGRDLPRRVRAAEPAAAARRQGLGAARQAQADPRDLHPPARRPAPARGLRRRRATGSTATSRQRKSRVEFLAFCRYIRTPLPARDPAALRAGQLQPAHRRDGPRTGPPTTTSSSPTRRSTPPG